MEDDPWLFRDYAVHLKKYDCFLEIDTSDMNSTDVSVRIMKVPDGLINKTIAKVMGYKVGEYVALAPRNFIGDFMRQRVRLSMDKPLVQFVHVTL